MKKIAVIEQIHKDGLEVLEKNSEYEYEYVEEYIQRSSLRLLTLDLWIIWKGIILILKGGGH